MIKLDEFLIHTGPIFDVRSPSEFTQGRIPGAVNLPLFTDQERASVGTTYKQVGQQEAIMQGLSFVGPKLVSYIEKALQHTQEEFVKVHCWRGGMRSSSMAWLLKTAGMKPITLQGGYKNFRKWVLGIFEKPYQLKVLGGFTGCGKTKILNALRNIGEQVIDLEGFANHRGSTFGNFGMPSQPSSEQFQNEIAVALSKLDISRPIWIEDESSMIGTCSIPNSFFSQMSASPMHLIQRPLEARLDILEEEYSHFKSEDLIEATLRISKRLGGLRSKEIVEHIQDQKFKQAAEVVLQYYDKAYNHSLSRRKPPQSILEAGAMTSSECALALISQVASPTPY
jgi:tRNA 2-selenouridine synthase